MAESKTEKTSRRIMPLISSAFEPGKSLEVINAIEDFDERELAWADYYQYTGRAEEALAKAEPYLDHEDPALRLSAHIIFFISGLAVGDAEGARNALLNLEQMAVEDNSPTSGKYCANMIKVMLFLREGEFDVGTDIPGALPEGAKFFACYFLALREYLRDESEKAIGLAKGALMLGGSKYPIAAIYLHIVIAASYMRMKKVEEAEDNFYLAWSYAEPDGFIAPFAQQYVMLAGLNKKCLKKYYAGQYSQISKYANNFIPAWIDAHYGLVDWHEDYSFSKIEHIVAMLIRKGYRVKEIASCMGVSVNTVKTHITSVYNKAGTTDRHRVPENIIR
jgi:DNA-binding CsgD family transcriptional regulator